LRFQSRRAATSAFADKSVVRCACEFPRRPWTSSVNETYRTARSTHFRRIELRRANVGSVPHSAPTARPTGQKAVSSLGKDVIYLLGGVPQRLLQQRLPSQPHRDGAHPQVKQNQARRRTAPLRFANPTCRGTLSSALPWHCIARMTPPVIRT